MQFTCRYTVQSNTIPVPIHSTHSVLLTDDSYGGHVSKQRRTIALYSFLYVTNTISYAGSGLIDTDPASACTFFCC